MPEAMTLEEAVFIYDWWVHYTEQLPRFTAALSVIAEYARAAPDSPAPARRTCVRCGIADASVTDPLTQDGSLVWFHDSDIDCIHALRAECARLQAYADKLAEGLPMLPNDIALMQSGNADMATKLNAIDSACLKACPDNSAETMDEPDADVGRYLCLNENGDPLIDTDDPAEVVARLHELWGSVSEKCEAAEYKLSTINPGAPRDGE